MIGIPFVILVRISNNIKSLGFRRMSNLVSPGELIVASVTNGVLCLEEVICYRARLLGIPIASINTLSYPKQERKSESFSKSRSPG